MIENKIGARERRAQLAAERQRQRARAKMAPRRTEPFGPPPPPPPAYFDDREVETITGLDTLTVAKLWMDGVLERRKVGRKFMISGDSVRRLMGFDSEPMDTETAAKVRLIALTKIDQLRAGIRADKFYAMEAEIERLRGVLYAVADERIASVRRDLRQLMRFAWAAHLYENQSDLDVRRDAIYRARHEGNR